jgi:hypothetical protein
VRINQTFYFLATTTVAQRFDFQRSNFDFPWRPVGNIVNQWKINRCQMVFNVGLAHDVFNVVGLKAIGAGQNVNGWIQLPESLASRNGFYSPIRPSVWSIYLLRFESSDLSSSHIFISPTPATAR